MGNKTPIGILIRALRHLAVGPVQQALQEIKESNTNYLYLDNITITNTEARILWDLYSDASNSGVGVILMFGNHKLRKTFGKIASTCPSMNWNTRQHIMDSRNWLATSISKSFKT
eukprot:GHVP01044566.1.p1 GENE.GHVP01044566.1~~GHVP01044566.1.p1  ORF type:complete len:115 (+),score=10.48 GHVP01044566.1:401-745(+)